MKHIPTTLLISGALALALAATPAFADGVPANTSYKLGDLILYFQQESATASTQSVQIDLGSAATVFRGSSVTTHVGNIINIANINSILTSTFGAGWATDPTLYAGLAANYSDVGGLNNTVTNNDDARTFYTSASRTAVGTAGSSASTQVNVANSTNQLSTATAITTMLGGQQYTNPQSFGGVTPATTQAVLTNTLVDTANPFTVVGSTYYQGTAFGTIAGGVEQGGSATLWQNGAGLGSVSSNIAYALDLQRVNSSSTYGLAGSLYKGDYLGTVVVQSNGQVDFITTGTGPTTNSAYNTWIANYPSLTGTNQLPSADPDNSGVNNLQKYALGGSATNATNNGYSLTKTANGSTNEYTLSIEALSGATFTASGNAMTATVSNVTYTVQGSTDLVTWNTQVTEVTPTLATGSPASGYTFHTFLLNGSSGLTGKGFIRVHVASTF